MSYLESIIWLISWPVLIFATYRVILFLLNRMDYLYDVKDVNNNK